MVQAESVLVRRTELEQVMSVILTDSACTITLLLYTDYTVKNWVFQNSCLGCLNVHSSTTPYRVFLKLPFEGVTGHPRTPFQLAMNNSKECYVNIYTLLILNCVSL